MSTRSGYMSAINNQALLSLLRSTLLQNFRVFLMVEYLYMSAESDWQPKVPQIYGIFKQYEGQSLKQKQLDCMRSQIAAVLKKDDREPNPVRVRLTLHIRRVLVDHVILF